jgi:hypothetical protein
MVSDDTVLDSQTGPNAVTGNVELTRGNWGHASAGVYTEALAVWKPRTRANIL